MNKLKKYELSASLISSDLSNLDKTLKNLKIGRIDYIHFDVMDGIFVPRYGLPPELLKITKERIKVPVNIHMMIKDVEPYIESFAGNGADYITFHIETTNHANRLIDLIHKKGMKAGVALNPATPLNVLDYLLDQIDLIMIMAINPGIPGHELIPNIYRKISELKSKVAGYKNIKIEIDGGVNSESAPKMVNLGADILVCGSHSIFKKDKDSVPLKINKLRKQIETNYGV